MITSNPLLLVYRPFGCKAVTFRLAPTKITAVPVVRAPIVFGVLVKALTVMVSVSIKSEVGSKIVCVR
jgi:hypothetical protein